MRLLEKVKGRMVKGGEKKRRSEEKKINKEEIREAIIKLKDGKAAGIDGVCREKYGSTEKKS